MKKLMSVTLLSMLLLFQFVSAIPVSANVSDKDFVQDVRVKTQQGNIVDENSPPLNVKDHVVITYDWGNNGNITQPGEISLAIPKNVVVQKDEMALVSKTGAQYGRVTVNPNKQEMKILIEKEIPSSENGSFEILAALNTEKNAKEILLTLDTGKNSKQVRVPIKAEPKLQALKTAITTNIVTSAELTDTNGKAFTEANRPTVDTAARLAYEWALPDSLNAKAGDTYTFKLPDIFTLYSKVTGTLGDYGTFVAGTDGTVTMTFNENVELDSNVAGTLQFNTRFDLSKTDKDTTQTVTFPVADKDSFDLHFIPQNAEDVTKVGTANRAFSPDGVNWTVRVNGQEDVLHNASLKDTLPAGLTLDTDSIEVYRLQVSVDGTAKLDGLADVSEYTIGSSTGQSLEIQFADGKSTEYEVRYKTKIEDATKTSFKNAAVFTNDDVKASTSATVAIKRGDHLKKRGVFDPKTERIKWTISYNFDEKSVAQKDAVLHDLFDNVHQLVADSVVVKNITLDANGKVIAGAVLPTSDYQVIPTTTTTQNGFDLQFQNDISRAYEITYETSLKDTASDLTTVKNEVETTNTPKESAAVSVATQNITKQLVDSDYSTKTMSWAQQINTNQYSLDNAVIRDSFASGGLTLLPETLKLVDQDAANKPLVQGADYDITANADGFVITLLNGYASDMTHTLNLTYDTKFLFEDIKTGTAFQNDTRLEWGQTDEKRSSTDTASLEPDYYTQKNGFKLGAYDAQSKEITWTVGFNYNLLTIDKPILKDAIPSDQKLLPDTVEVHKMQLGKEPYNYSDGGIVDSSDYTLDTGGNTVLVTFKEPITEAYYVTFKTSIADEKIVPTYLNSATLYDGETPKTTVTGFVNVPNGGEYVAKSGIQEDDTLHWTVNVNAGQSTITDAKIIDTPKSNQILLADSIKLYSTKVQKNGAFTQDKALVPDVDYKLTIHTDGETGKQTFEIAFTDTITSAYILKYDTYIDAGDNEVVSNDVNLAGSNLTDESTKTSADVIVRFSEGSGSGSAERGTLTVRKVDAKTKSTLSGAEFGLYNSDGTVLLREATTNEAGDIIFASIRYGDYLVKELNAPTGYFKSDTSEGGITFKMDQKEPLLVIENDKFVGEAILTKVEKGTDNHLEGAVFNLMQGNQVIQSDLQTDANGEIHVTNLTPGDYTFVETSAPTGYKLDTTAHPFTIDEKQTEPARVAVENELILGTLIIKKQDSITKTPLSGATFDLFDSQGNIVYQGLNSDFEGTVTVTNLPLGDYQLIETSAPNDYELDATPIPITISKAITTENVYYQIIENTLITGGVTLTKVDSTDKATHLQGASFELLDSSGNIVQADLETDEKGQITISGLLPGDYNFVETSAPTGYQLDETPLPFTIEKSQQAFVEIEATNKKMETPSEIDDTQGEEPTKPDTPEPGTTEPDTTKPDQSVTPVETTMTNPAHLTIVPTTQVPLTPLQVSASGAPMTKPITSAKNKTAQKSNLPETGDTANDFLPLLGYAMLLGGILYTRKRISK